ncbi:hypothetical protein [Streptomyces rubellomurinus]|uniref:Uncharacterized protein n=1 Tax=Streptomyces rubellomurinus (strain ATCC 31215) TaxID=359131 RepID=A0A0F2TDW2_STRR3|nr:hypothetical protein [Streptomyces rubellomurinus]KJS61403.1 hypothetical protein VM95_15515 [Streptomyces rubellomurinus]
MNEPDADGRKLSAAFERTMDGLGPELGPLVAASARQGRSIRRRRRLTVAGAVTAVAALAIGDTVALRPGDGGTTAVGLSAASPTASPSGTDTPAPTPSRRFPQPLQRTEDTVEPPLPGSGQHTGKVALTGRTALSALVKALPQAGRTSGYAGHSALIKANAADPGSVLTMANMLYDDGAGPADVRIMIEGGLGDRIKRDSHPNEEDLMSCSVINRGGQFRYCSDSVLPDGSHLLLMERVTGDILSRSVSLLRADQARISVSATNAAEVADHAKVQVVREGLPLTLDQLKAAAMSPDLPEWITPEQAKDAEHTIRPFRDDTPGRTGPSTSATPKPGATG